ncbi:MAG: RIP metalloprotease RseP [Candidatus Omnitrophica bacterium]|nr:RIP metalloprotease RseP [Candidatus Omnitrophota bacterium]
MGERRGGQGYRKVIGYLMLNIIAVVIVFSILIVVHEFGHFMMAKRCGVKVERFSLGFGPKLISIKKGETEYMISLVPLGGYVKLAGESHQDKLTGEGWEFLSKPPGQRFKIVACGPFLNYILGIILFSLVFMIGAPTLTNKVGEVLEDYPAYASGIRPGDKIVSIDGKEVRYWHELTEIMHKKLEGAARLEILRRESTLNLVIKPKIKEFKDIFGKDVKIAMVGIAPSDELIYIKHNPAESFYRGLVKTFQLTAITFKAIWNLMIGRLSFRESVTGPVGIFMLTAKAARLGLVYLLNLMAIISTSLAIFNILPIPVLDGGHILFILIEKIRRRPLSPKAQETSVQIGLGILIVLMLFVFYYDIMRIISR